METWCDDPVGSVYFMPPEGNKETDEDSVEEDFSSLHINLSGMQLQVKAEAVTFSSNQIGSFHS